MGRPCPAVVYNGSGYAAWPQQFRVGCWRGFDGDAAAASPTDTFALAPNCSSPAQVVAPTDPADAFAVYFLAAAGLQSGAVPARGNRETFSASAGDIQVYASFSNRSVALSFGRETGAGSIALCANCTLAVGKLSFYHENWLPFQNGVLALDNVTGAPNVTLRLECPSAASARDAAATIASNRSTGTVGFISALRQRVAAAVDGGIDAAAADGGRDAAATGDSGNDAAAGEGGSDEAAAAAARRSTVAGANWLRMSGGARWWG